MLLPNGFSYIPSEATQPSLDHPSQIKHASASEDSRKGTSHSLEATKSEDTNNPPLKSPPAKEKTTEVGVEAVPAPEPDTGIYPSFPLIIHSGVLPVISPTTLAPPPTPTTPSHLRATTTFSMLLATSSRRNRPRKRSCPTPSLPILQDQFLDQDLKMDDESLFGGKERTSTAACPDSNGVYPWTQYTPKPSISSLATLAAKNASVVFKADSLPAPPPRTYPVERQEPCQVPNCAPVFVTLPLHQSPVNPAAQQMQQAYDRAANRLSSISTSIYPSTMQSSHVIPGVGLAIGGASPLVLSDSPTFEHKPGINRSSACRLSYHHSLTNSEYTDVYGGTEFSSPVPSPLQPPPRSTMRKSSTANPTQGRARVKAGYTPGASGGVIRSSTTVSGLPSLSRSGNRSSMVNLEYVLPPLTPALKTDAHRERNTRALTSALGLSTPSFHPSPVPMSIPDNSATLAGDRKRDKGAGHHHAQSGVTITVMSPSEDSSAARLGQFMLGEGFASSKDFGSSSMSSMPSVFVTPSASRGRVPVTRKNVGTSAQARSSFDDRPPRVPSPPPLPTLAQMALAHSNSVAYDDYRSPTYSIYGLYEAERKSRLQSENVV
ncbi:uncharacterized protein BXZ73DRAFT_36867 [Epithele typhae]|uniref:uncharacterized protein n=1 Tax=Epithele typhae TaxID=378194 RepID=UPI002008A202|nr:uncharacterized protein BXZ73DRAFT_36867 [Epithele typhae]KAH9946120.1 hypothetical protein BXZ73DRAFT_36867 [Epithele typhae]